MILLSYGFQKIHLQDFSMQNLLGSVFLYVAVFF